MGKDLVKTKKGALAVKQKSQIGDRKHFFTTANKLSQLEGHDKDYLASLAKQQNYSALDKDLLKVICLGAAAPILASILLPPIFFLILSLVIIPIWAFSTDSKANQKYAESLIPTIASKFLLSNFYVDYFWVKTIRNKETITLQLIHKTYQAEWKEKNTALEHFSYFYKQQIGKDMKPNKKRGKFVSEVIQEQTFSVTEPGADVMILDVASDMKLETEELNREARQKVTDEIMTQISIVDMTKMVSQM